MPLCPFGPVFGPLDWDIWGFFLQFLLPLIIEKLDSDVQSSKLDSLLTLVRSLWFKRKKIMVLGICSWIICLWLHIMFYLSTLLLFQAACVQRYEHKDLAEFLKGLWVSLRREVCCEIWDFDQKGLLLIKVLANKVMVMNNLCHCRCFRQRVRKSSPLLLLPSPQLLPACHVLSSSLTLRTLFILSFILFSKVK